MTRLPPSLTSRTFVNVRARLGLSALLIVCGATLGSAAACGSTANTSAGTGGTDATGTGPGSSSSGQTSSSSSGVGGFLSSSSTTSTSTSTSSSSSSGSGSGTGGGGGAVPNPCLPDFDGDGIPDDVEGKATNVDTNHDGIPDWMSLDSDGDTIPDHEEAQIGAYGCLHPIDSDGDGIPDFQDFDSDNNGLLDRDEIYPDRSPYNPKIGPADTDLDGIPDYADPDNDNDGMLDPVELLNGQWWDTDGDGIPDLDDTDSDNDTIADLYEGNVDPFNTGIPAFRNADSDGDGISDKCEAGGHSKMHLLADPPDDADNDGRYNFLDLDSDNDGLLDTNEDANHDCIVGSGESDPYVADTDGDGADDLVEVLLGSDPNNPNQTPASLGKYYFLLPYQQAAYPATDVVPIQTSLNQADVAFIIDTSSAMGPALANVKTGVQSLIGSLRNPPPPQVATISDIAVAIAGHADFPIAPYGISTDKPFYVAGTTGYSSTAASDNLAALITLFQLDGADVAQSQIAAYQRALTDGFLGWPGNYMSPSGAPSGTFGSLHFRTGSLPIIVGISNGPFHNGRWASDPSNLHAQYSFNGAPTNPTPTADSLVTAMNAVGARFIGIDASGEGRSAGSEPYDDMAFITDSVASDVPASAFGGQCATGPGGSFVGAEIGPTPANPSGLCRLIFDISQDGSGLTTSVVSGVNALAKSIHLDMRVLAVPDPNGAPPDPNNPSLDAVDIFVKQLDVNFAGLPDPADLGHPCIQLLDPVHQLADVWYGVKGLMPGKDGFNETVVGITPTQKVCFNLTPTPNITIPQQMGAQVFYASLAIRGKNGAATTELPIGTPKQIAFIVPPLPQ